MEIHTYVTPLLRSNMYLLVENGRGVILDPFYSKEHVESILAVSPIIDYIILTHEHYDHISGANDLRMLFHCPVLCSATCAERIKSPAFNLSRYEETYLSLQEGEPIPFHLFPIKEYSTCADETFYEQKLLNWRGHILNITETPGHSPGSTCILLDDQTVFSGDSLLFDNSFVLRFPGRSRCTYLKKTIPFFLSLRPEVLVYPGHYESFKLQDHPEWKHFHQMEGTEPLI